MAPPPLCFLSFPASFRPDFGQKHMNSSGLTCGSGQGTTGEGGEEEKQEGNDPLAFVGSSRDAIFILLSIDRSTDYDLL